MEITAAEEPQTQRRFYYGWVMLPLAMLAMFASSPGQTFGVSIFNESLREHLKLDHSQLSGAYSLGTILGSIPLFFIGRLTDRHGIRPVILVSLCVFCGACLFLSVVQNWWMLLFAFFLLRMLGPGTLALLSGNILPFWFQKRLGSVESLRQLSASASMGLVPMLNVWLLAEYGWRSAYFLWGMGLFLVLFPAFFFAFKNPPDQQRGSSPAPKENLSPVQFELGESFTLKEAMRTPAFLVVTVGCGLFAMIMTAISFQMVPILEENGLKKTDAAIAFGMSAVVMAVAQVSGGNLADRVASWGLILIGLLALCATPFAFCFATTPVLAQLAGGCMGFAQGFFFSSTQPLWARYFGLKNLGSIRGTVMTVMVASSSLGPYFAGFTRDLTGSFRTSLICFAILPMPLVLCSFLVRPPAKKPSLASDVV